METNLKLMMAMVATAALTACGGGGGGGGHDVSTNVPLAQAPALVQQYAALFNAIRVNGWTCGSEAMPPVPPLTMWNPQLQASAQAHADDMNANNYFSHTRLDGKTAADYGYSGSPQAENLAGGQGSPSAITQAWLNSPGHCRSLMNGYGKSVVIGLTGRYTVMVYGD